MRIILDSAIVFSKRYESFEDLSDDHIDYESKHGRSVPNYNYEDWIRELVFFLIAIVIADLQSRRDLKGIERRHKELMAKLNEKKDSESIDSSGVANTVLEYATENEIDIEVQTETEVESELWDTFQEMTRSGAIRIKHDRSIAGRLSRYADKSTVKRDDEQKAWEEQTSEEWRSQN